MKRVKPFHNTPAYEKQSLSMEIKIFYADIFRQQIRIWKIFVRQSKRSSWFTTKELRQKSTHKLLIHLWIWSNLEKRNPSENLKHQRRRTKLVAFSRGRMREVKKTWPLCIWQIFSIVYKRPAFQKKRNTRKKRNWNKNWEKKFKISKKKRKSFLKKCRNVIL